MSKVNRFEDLQCWQSSRVLVKKVYSHCKKGELSKDYDTKSQLKSCALSCMNNIAEVLQDLIRENSSDFWIFLKAPHQNFKVCFMY